MKLQIIGFDRSNFVRTVRMVAHEKDVEYELVPQTPHSLAVKAINPFGLIPVMRHGDLQIGESQAIARYLDRIGSGAALIPAAPVFAARVDAWVATIATNIDKVLLRQYVVPYIFHKDDDGNVIRTDIDKAIKRFPRVFGTLNDAVSGGYVVGDTFSMADCFIMPMLAVAQMFPEGKAAMAEHAALKEYFERVGARESFVATAPSA
jgi:glutathione S-transferase